MSMDPRDTGTQISGLPASLPVATPRGWRPAGALQPGDPVWCLDAAPQPLVSVVRAPDATRLAVQVPRRVLGNPEAVLLLPDQPVALDLGQAAVLYGHPLALIPARALLGWRGIAPCPLPPQPLVRLAFACRQILQAGPGLLLACATATPPTLIAEAPPALPLTAAQARHLMACVMAEEAGAALRPPPYAAF